MTAGPGVLAVEPTRGPVGEPVSEPLRVGVQDAAADGAARLKAIVAQHYTFLWRLLRRLGVMEADVEDEVQKCLLVISQRLDDVPPEKERSFLFGVALRVARAARRETRRETGGPGGRCDPQILDAMPASGPDADQALDERRARAMLDALLDVMPLDLRTVFVLYEIEELTMAEIASALDVPMGTVASRLRRARETFEALSLRLQKQLRGKRAAR
jgi:RNA polymerase sigma-70 factor (ECF subfamily)